MKTFKQTAAILAIVMLFFSCHKELSFETISNFAIVSVHDTCTKAVTVRGKGHYVRDSSLNSSICYVEVQVDVHSPGLYNISTNQNNGFYFVDSGFLVNTITTTLKLKAIGTPIASMVTPFTLTFNGIESCSFNVEVTDSIVNYATYKLDSAGNCLNKIVDGVYEGGVPLNSSNTLTMDVDVLTEGLYEIETEQNGMTFTGEGEFIRTGLQTITLTGSGTPIQAGQTVFAVEGLVDGTPPMCNFAITVDSVDYFPTTTNSNWTYGQNITPDTTVVKVLPVDLGIITNGDTLIYRQFQSTNVITGVDTFLYRKTGHAYYQYSNTNLPEPFDNVIYDTVIGEIDFPFLKDNVAVNSTWTSDTLTTVKTGVLGSSRISFKIVAKNISIMVNSVNYDTVIQVHRDYEFKSATGASYSSGASAELYYQRNKGLIKADYIIPGLPTVVNVYVKRIDIR